jgi:hypothetical protein
MMKRIIKNVLNSVILGIICLLSGVVLAGKPIFLIVPTQKAPNIIYSGQQASAIYQITNNTSYALNGNGVVDLPAGVKQIGGTCSTPFFNLPIGSSCTINLQITADELLGNLTRGPLVCNTPGNRVYCSKPSVENELGVVKSNSPPPATISSSPSTLILTTVFPGNTAMITVTNSTASPVSADNVTADVSGTGGALSVGYTNCNTVEPGGTCTITLTANSTLASTTIPIQGSNTNSTTVAVAVDQAALGASPTSFNLLDNGTATQVVTITNNGPVDAYDVGVTSAPGLGVTVLGSCPSPLVISNTCTLTFKSGTTAGSTTATIAGSNTTNPPVTVAIVVGTVPNLSITAPTQGNRYVNLDTSTALDLTIANAADSIPTSISASGPVTSSGSTWSNVTIGTSACQNLQPGDSCTLTLNTTSPNVPGQLTITGTNGANTLTTWVATNMNSGLVFYVNGSTVKVAQPTDISESTLWQVNSVFTSTTDDNDGCANTQSILTNVGTSHNAASLCTTTISSNVCSSADTGWYFPAICEMGFGLTGGPGDCNANYQFNDMTSLYAFNPGSFTGHLGNYWSSTESTPGSVAWSQSFASSTQESTFSLENTNFFGVRCVKAFNP